MNKEKKGVFPYFFGGGGGAGKGGAAREVFV